MFMLPISNRERIEYYFAEGKGPGGTPASNFADFWRNGTHCGEKKSEKAVFDQFQFQFNYFLKFAIC